MSIIVFGITTNKGLSGYAGEIPLYQLHGFFRLLSSQLNTTKIRLHTRKPTSNNHMIKVSHSSIALYFYGGQKFKEKIAGDILKDTLNKYAQLDAGSTYELIIMEQYKERAIMITPEYDDTRYTEPMDTKYHNEWFAMPLNDHPSFHRYGKDECEDSMYTRIYDYDPFYGHINMFRGNNEHDHWIVVAKTPTTYYTYLNSVRKDGIYDSITGDMIPNETNPLANIKPPSKPSVNEQAENILKAIEEATMRGFRKVRFDTFELYKENIAYLTNNGFVYEENILSW